jgi:chitinase
MPNTSMNYAVLNYAFAVGSGTDGATLVMWTPSATNPLTSAASDIAATEAQGRKVLLSLGGATSPNITLLNSTDVSNFVSSVEGLVSQYGFQGIDLDFENSSVTVNAGDSLTNPTTPDIMYLAQALSQIKSHFGSSFIITYVPETADIDAYAAYSGEWGGYLALIGATRSILTYVDTQCYDSGSMNAANGQVVSEGTADFMVAMSELLLHGYTISGGQTFAALSPSQVAFGNLYNGTAASTAVSAYKYLTTGASDGGSYKLLGGPYPNMAGVMVWDINGDATQGYSYSNTLVAGGLK